MTHRVAQAGIAGTHIITIPYKILTQMPFYKKTEDGHYTVR